MVSLSFHRRRSLAHPHRPARVGETGGVEWVGDAVWLGKRMNGRTVALVLLDPADPGKAPQFIPLPEEAPPQEETTGE